MLYFPPAAFADAAPEAWDAGLAPQIRSIIGQGPILWPGVVQAAIRAGLRSREFLTDLAFFTHFPDRNGRPIAAGEPGATDLVEMWRFFNARVGEILAATSTPSLPRGPLTSFQNIRRVWVHTNTNTVVGTSARARRRRAQLCDLRPTDIVIGTNDISYAHTAFRTNGAFRVYRTATPGPNFDAAIAELKSCGARIHFMTWITPTERWVDEMAATMFALCRRAGARSLLLDAEEPWTKRSASTYPGFVDTVVKPALAAKPCCVGTTHIVAKSVRPKVGPLIRATDYALPQAYPTGSFPGKIQRWAVENYGLLGKPIVMGLSGGSSKSRTDMWHALAASDRLGVAEVYYWSFGLLRTNRTRLDVVKQAANLARATPGLVPRLCSRDR
ncbi:hypothetical protein [Pontivivens ytuae]|uniref:Uncharacterized protein n=1 Tax=Pontivivens ytuae TaxID=2789856 RepID=A0A7S9QBN2_9RHOB|nr:hypothetical protein [Pontivivens ytuae]QPH53343.1 hypothetical protein I0K15_16350 [Pontivivens ytuae]